MGYSSLKKYTTRKSVKVIEEDENSSKGKTVEANKIFKNIESYNLL